MKVVLIGDSKVGKSYLISRFAIDFFSGDHAETTGVGFVSLSALSKHLRKVDGVCRKCSARLPPVPPPYLNIWKMWDTAGIPASAHSAKDHGVVIVYDVTNLTSFNNIERWSLQAGDSSNRDSICRDIWITTSLLLSGDVSVQFLVPFSSMNEDSPSWQLIGNKCDLTTLKQVDYTTAKAFGDKTGIPLVETSARDSINVELAFVQLAVDIMELRSDSKKTN